MIGTQIGSYRVAATLGEGGMGTVYRARDEMLERDVALKVLKPDLAANPDLVARFKTEAIALARLSHPNVAAVYGLLIHEGQFLIALEYLEGETIESLLKRERALPPGRAVEIASAVLSALDFAHRRGIVHRDVKSSNVMILPDGTVKVMDFGIARVLGGGHQTRTGYIVGTLGYMAPEQIKGEAVDGRADVYSTGILMYEMLTGRLPFRASSEWALMQAQIEALPEPPRHHADMPEALEAAVLRALAKHPADRHRSAEDFKHALEAAIPVAWRPRGLTDDDDPTEEIVPLDGRGIANPSGPAGAAGGASQRPRLTPVNWRHWVGAAVVLALVAGTAVGVLRWGATPEPAGGPAASATSPVAGPAPTAPSALHSPAPGPAADSPVTSTPSQASPEPAAAPAAAQNSPRSPRKPGAQTPAASRPAGAAGARESGAPTPAARADDTPARLPESSPAPPAPAGPAVFDAVKWLQQDASGKAREVDAEVRLLDDRLDVVTRKGGAPLKTIAYRAIQAATYSQSKHPRWKQGAGAAVLVGVLAAPVFFMKSTKHWVTLQTDNDFAVLRLEKDSQRLFIPAFETRSGHPIEVLAAEK